MLISMVDIFGKILKGYLNGDTPFYNIRRGDGNYCCIDTSNYFTNYQDWSNCEKEIISNYAQGRVLDVGAGAGRHSLFLKNRGLEVHSVDNSSFAVNLMKIRGLNNVHLMDLRKMDFPDAYFNSVLMISNDLGFAGSIKDTRKFLKNLFRIVKPDGKIIVTVRDPNRYISKSQESFVYNNHERRLAKIVDKIRLRLEYKNELGDWFYSILASPEELKNLIKGTGWVISRTIENNDCNFYGVIMKKKTDIKKERI